jgi:hypothetical protein
VVDDAMVAGEVGLDGVTRLARAAGRRREELFDRDVEVLVDHARRLHADDLETVLRRWEALADDEAARDDARHGEERRGVRLAPTVGGYRIDGWLGVEGAFLHAALAALMDLPDPKDAPVRRTVSQRRADALVDLSHQWLTDHGIECDDDLAADDEDVTEAHHAADAPPQEGDPVDAVDGDEDPAGEGFAGDDDGDAGDQPTFVADPDDPAEQERARRARRERRGRSRRRRASRSRGPATAVEVRVDLDVLQLPDHVPEDLTRESSDVVGLGPVGRAVVERFACDAWIGRMVTAGPSQVLDVGQRTPTFSRAQRRAIARRDQHCAYPGCARPADWCDAHHLVHREHEGPTSVDNGCLLCRWHHVTLHVRRQRLERRPDGSYELLEGADG